MTTPDLFGAGGGEGAPPPADGFPPDGIRTEALGFRVVTLTVYGTPEPAGSKSAAPYNVGDKVRVAVRDANPRAKDWKRAVTQAAGELMAGAEPLEGALEAVFTFYRARLKGHFGTGRNAGKVRASAPAYPTTRPDVLKLARAVEDGLTGVMYRDDSRIVSEHLAKLWGMPERVEITVRQLTRK